jgi:hypothetical protein
MTARPVMLGSRGSPNETCGVSDGSTRLRKFNRRMRT